MVYAQPRICPGEWDAQTPLGFWDTNGSPNLARELKKLWNMKVTVVPIVIGALDTVTKGFVKELEDLEMRGRVETI